MTCNLVQKTQHSLVPQANSDRKLNIFFDLYTSLNTTSMLMETKYTWYSRLERKTRMSDWYTNTWCRNILHGLHSSPVKLHFLSLKQWWENLSPEAAPVYRPPKNPFLLLSNLWPTVLKHNTAFRTLEQRSITPKHMISKPSSFAFSSSISDWL